MLINFILIAIIELFFGYIMIKFCEPEKDIRLIFCKFSFFIDDVYFDVHTIKKANKITFYYCVMFSILTVVNGFLFKFSLLNDYKDVLLIGLLFSYAPVRYACLFILKRQKQ